MVTFKQAVRRLAVAVEPALPGLDRTPTRRLQRGLAQQDPGHRRPVQARHDRQDGEDDHARARPELVGQAEPKLDRIITRALDSDAGDQRVRQRRGRRRRPRRRRRATTSARRAPRTASCARPRGPDFRHFTFNGTSDEPERRAASARRSRWRHQPRGDRARPTSPGSPGRRSRWATTSSSTRRPATRTTRATSARYDPDKAEAAARRRPAGSSGAAACRKKDGKPLTLRFVIPAGVPGQQAGGRADAGDAQGDRRQGRHRRRCRATTFFDKYVIPGNFDITPFSWLGHAVPDLVGAVDLRQAREGRQRRARRSSRTSRGSASTRSTP